MVSYGEGSIHSPTGTDTKVKEGRKVGVTKVCLGSEGEVSGLPRPTDPCIDTPRGTGNRHQRRSVVDPPGPPTNVHRVDLGTSPVSGPGSPGSGTTKVIPRGSHRTLGLVFLGFTGDVGVTPGVHYQ